MSIFSWIDSLFQTESQIAISPGVILDPRTADQKTKDWTHDEIATAQPVAWTEKPQNTWRRFPIFNQDGSSACMANMTAKMLGIENKVETGNFIKLSPRDFYLRRQNAPQGGMWLQDVLSIATNFGATIDELLPSDGKNETQMNDASDRKPYKDQIAQVFKAGGYVIFKDPTDIDAIAGIISQGKAVGIVTHFNNAEWAYASIPRVNPNLVPNEGHGIAAVDYTLYNGEKAIIIDDSWGLGYALNGQRILTESWIKARVYGAGYLLQRPNNWQDFPDIPKHYFQPSTILKFEMMQNGEVIALQNILAYEGLFPKGLSTGNYGNITASGVLAFQNKYKLPATDGKIVDINTIILLNQLYGH